MKHDTFLISILGVIAVLVVAALALFFIRQGQETYQNQDSPASVTHDYILALQKGDFQRAYSYLADAADKPDLFKFKQTFSPDQMGFSSYSVQIGDEQIIENQASVALILTQEGGGLFGQTYQNSQPVDLTRQNGSWKITTAPYPYWGYDWYQATYPDGKTVPASPTLTPAGSGGSMRTIRRVYFYAIAVVSLEVVIWGVIGLLRSIFDTGMGGQANLLAGSLSLVLVGVPVFAIHWWTAQKGALKDLEERAARTRALFLYGVLAGLLVPCVQNGLALANRLTLAVLGLQWNPLIGSNQTVIDNLVAIAANAGAAVYFYLILKDDWKSTPAGNSLADLRRLYRILWMVYSLGLTFFGTQQVLHFLFYLPTGFSGRAGFFLADGLALLLVGTPLWVFFWQTLQNAALDTVEGESRLRLVVLYGLSLAGAAAALVESGIILNDLLRWALGSAHSFASLLQAAGLSLSVAIPLAGVWSYYGRWLQADIEKVTERPRRASLHRLYRTILAAFGLGAVIFGLWQLFSFVVNAAVTQQVGSDALRNQISTALSALLIGLPLWGLTWRSIQRETGQVDDAGDYSRRSGIRKSYLYLVLFATVIGVMASAGEAIYLLIKTLIGTPVTNPLQSELNALQSLLLFALWLAYHLRVLHQDGRLAELALVARHRQFPVLVIDPGNGFGQEIAEAMQRTAAHIPVTVRPIGQDLPVGQEAAVKAVILPSFLAVHPPEALSAWLGDYPGMRLVVPAPQDGWQWVGSVTRNSKELSQQAAQAIRQIAEGQPVRLSSPITPWAVVGFILGGLFALQIAFILVALVISLL